MEKTLSPVLIQIHWGVCKGGAFVDGESSSIFTVESVAEVGQKNISLSDSTGLLVGQVIAYTDTIQYYSSKIATIDSNMVTLEDNLEVTVPTGDNVFSWYTNNSHPTTQGMYSIIDYAKRYLQAGNRMGDQERVFDVFGADLLNGTLLGTASIAVDATNDYLNPGFPNYGSANITCNASGDGLSFDTDSQSASTYSYDVLINAGPSGVMTILFKSGETILKTVEHTTEGSSIKLFNGQFQLKQSGIITVEITSTGNSFKIGYIRINKKIVANDNLDSGTHVILGDSWAALGSTTARLQNNYSNATFYNEGVGGNTVSMINARFDTDVVPHKPRYIWIFVGTNDVFNSNFSTFNSGIQELITKCVTIGAKPIIFDCSVCPRVYSGKADWELTNKSHEYALLTDYNSDEGVIVSGFNDPASKWQIKITAKENIIGGSITNFSYPFLLSGIPADQLAQCRSDRLDLRVFDSNGTALDRIIQLNGGVLTFKADGSAAAKDFYLEGGSGVEYANSTAVFDGGVLALNFDETTGDYIDSTGGGNAALNVAGDITRGNDGKLGKAVQFSGGGGYLQVADRDNLSFGTNGPCSIIAWVFLPTGTSTINLLDKSGEYRSRISSGSPGTFRYSEGSTTIYQGRTAPAIASGQWIQIVCQIRTDTIQEIWCNGVKVDNAYLNNGTFVGMTNTANPVTIGKFLTTNANGKICRLIVRNSALSAVEIAAYYSYEGSPNSQYTIGSVITKKSSLTLNTPNFKGGSTIVNMEGNGNNCYITYIDNNTNELKICNINILNNDVITTDVSIG